MCLPRRVNMSLYTSLLKMLVKLPCWCKYLPFSGLPTVSEARSDPASVCIEWFKHCNTNTELIFMQHKHISQINYYTVHLPAVTSGHAKICTHCHAFYSQVRNQETANIHNYERWGIYWIQYAQLNYLIRE